jgi:hypothetical protein
MIYIISVYHAMLEGKCDGRQPLTWLVFQPGEFNRELMN